LTSTTRHGNEVELHTLCIAPEHQSRGIGSHVTRALVADARSAGRGVTLSVLSVTATVYPEVNAVLQELLSGARALLGPRFVGMYLDGSLAIGDFDPGKSDLDFVVVTEG